jgi:hypothetical protein
MNVKLLLIILLGFVCLQIFFNFFPRIIYPGSIGGNFGLRPRSHACFGLALNPGLVRNLFIPGDISFKFLFSYYEYHVDYKNSEVYCLGQDIWYGE